MRSQSSTTCGLSGEEPVAASAVGSRPSGSSVATAAPAKVPKVRERRVSIMGNLQKGDVSDRPVWSDDPRRAVRVPAKVTNLGIGSAGRDQVALGDQLTHDREVRRAEVLRLALEEVGDGIEDLAHRQLAVARAHERRLDGVDLTGPAEPGLLTQHDRLGILRAGGSDGLLLDIGPRDQPVVEADLDPDGTAPVTDRRGDRLLDRVRPVEELAGRPAAAEVDPPDTDALDALALEPAQPRVVRLEVAGRAVASGVAQPELDVRRGVEHLALDHERVAARIEPARQTLVPGAVTRDGPVGEDLAPAAVGEVGGRPAHDQLDHLVTGEPG